MNRVTNSFCRLDWHYRTFREQFEAVNTLSAHPWPIRDWKWLMTTGCCGFAKPQAQGIHPPRHQLQQSTPEYKEGWLLRDRFRHRAVSVAALRSRRAQKRRN